MAITQLHPQHATGRRYGSFADKGIVAGVPHPVGILTQLHPQHATGGRYGSFADRGVNSPHPVGRITQLHPQHATGGRYGSFAGRVSGVVISPVEPLPGGGGGVDHFLPPRKRQQVAARIIEGYMFVREQPDGFYATGDVYESEKQVRARRNARALRILLLDS